MEEKGTYGSHLKKKKKKDKSKHSKSNESKDLREAVCGEFFFLSFFFFYSFFSDLRKYDSRNSSG